MRRTAFILLALGLVAAVAAGTARTQATGGNPGGTLSVEDGRGTVTITGKGVLIGRMEKGTLEITDLNPSDQWSPRVNGIPRGKLVTYRGKSVSFYIPGGRYKLVAHGTGISISARGTGMLTLDGEPDVIGYTGRYSIGDATTVPLPTGTLKIPFGEGDGSAPSTQSGKIQP